MSPCILRAQFANFHMRLPKTRMESSSTSSPKKMEPWNIWNSLRLSSNKRPIRINSKLRWSATENYIETAQKHNFPAFVPDSRQQQHPITTPKRKKRLANKGKGLRLLTKNQKMGRNTERIAWNFTPSSNSNSNKTKQYNRIFVRTIV